MHDRAAGIDIGGSEHWVCVDPDLTDQPIRRFGAFTEDLIALVAWLKALGVTPVAMESTGVYWREQLRTYLRFRQSRVEHAGLALQELTASAR